MSQKRFLPNRSINKYCTGRIVQYHKKKKNNVMYISENFSAPTKATSGRPAYSPALYQIKFTIAKLLISFRCKVKIREGQAEETASDYGCNRWWWQTCGGAGV